MTASAQPTKRQPRKIVIKFGGSLAQDPQVLSELTRAIADLSAEGNHVALVHGGGKDINENLKLLQEEVQFVDGLRVTDQNVLGMVEMTLSGKVNKYLVRLLRQHGCSAVGISGVDGMLMDAKKREGNPDLGFVGDVQQVHPEIVHHLWQGHFTPVISPISGDASGQAWNVNADTAASAVAVGVQADDLLFLSDVPGVLQEGEVIPELTEARVEELIAQKVIAGGMIPKTRSSIESLKQGISAIHITGWKGAQALEEQLLGVSNHGTILHI